MDNTIYLTRIVLVNDGNFLVCNSVVKGLTFTMVFSSLDNCTNTLSLSLSLSPWFIFLLYTYDYLYFILFSFQISVVI